MRTRTISASVAILMAAATLTACAPAANTPEGCAPSIAPGAASSQVQVKGEAGSKPEITFDAPIVTDGAEVSIQGASGRAATKGDIVDVDFTVVSGASGELLTTSYADGTQRPAQALRLTAGGETTLAQSVECATEGSRVILTSTIGDVFGEQAAAGSGMRATDTAVLVFDVDAIHPGRASGAPQPGTAGMPSLALAPNGQPGITFPGSPAPEELRITTTIAGDGRAVQLGDRVLVHYTGVVWESEKVFDSSWEKGMPAEFTLEQGSLIPGFLDAIVGQNVGSQVMVSIPQDQGYADAATRPSSIPEGAHLLFVVDILDVLEP